MQRTTVAGAVKVVSAIAALAVAWQAVRFCLGDIGNVTTPVFEFVSHSMGVPPGEPEPASFFRPVTLVVGLFQWLLGFTFWIVAAAVIAGLGSTGAHVLTVGWQQYRIEQREAQEAAQVAAQRQAAKDRRRELRRKVLEAQQPRRGSSSFFPFLFGLMLGAFFL